MGDLALRRSSAVLVVILFVTYLARSAEIAKIPLRAALKDRFDLSAADAATFFAVAGLAWYAKPLAGLLSDQVALFGTRRRHYVLVGGCLGAASWLAAALAAADDLGSLLALLVAANLFAALANTAGGGLLVDLGRRRDVLGPLSSLRVASMSLATFLGAVVGGWLAERDFMWTCIVAAALMLVMAAVLRATPGIEAPVADQPPPRSLGQRLRPLASREVWSVTLLMAGFHLAPGIDTLFFYHQHDVLRLTGLEIGLLSALNCVGGVLGALLYARFGARFSPALLVPAGILLGGGCLLSCLFYRSLASALIVEPLLGFCIALATLPLYELAARASPPGHEALVFGWMMSVGNLGLAGSDLLGAHIAATFALTLPAMIVLYAASTTLSVVLLRFVPASLLRHRAA